jgi:hypothetical protein
LINSVKELNTAKHIPIQDIIREREQKLRENIIDMMNRCAGSNVKLGGGDYIRRAPFL